MKWHLEGSKKWKITKLADDRYLYNNHIYKHHDFVWKYWIPCWENYYETLKKCIE